MISLSKLLVANIISILFLSDQAFALNFSSPIANQSLIKNGDFSEVDQDGNPVGWSCNCQGDKTTCDLKNDPVSKGKIITLKPGCELRSGGEVSIQNQGIRFEVTTKNLPVNFQDLSLVTYSINPLYGPYPYKAETAHPILSTKSSDNFILHADPLSSNNAKYIGVIIANYHDKNIVIKKIEALQSGENPTPKSAVLLKATHETILKILPHSTVKNVWIPLPIDYASQVPLWINLKPTPASAINSISYSQDDTGNWGAIIELKNNVAPGTEIHMQWEGITLTKMINEDERSNVYHDESDPNIWLQSTKIVESQYQPIVDMAVSLTKNEPDFIKKITNITSWEQKNLQPSLYSATNDATTVFDEKRADCVGFGNLTNAMGRAIGIPIRSIANILVGNGGLNTHYINEYYLGSDIGWRRIEPQSDALLEPEDNYLVIRKNTPDNESEKAFRHWSGAEPGTAFMSMIENLNDTTANVIFLPATNTFPECPVMVDSDFCDNRADHFVDLRGSHDEMKKLFESARKNWQYDMRAYLSTGAIDPKRQAIRATVLSIQNTDDLKKILDKLNGLLESGHC